MAQKGFTPWNEGLVIRDSHPQMGFQKGNTKWNNENSKFWLGFQNHGNQFLVEFTQVGNQKNIEKEVKRNI